MKFFPLIWSNLKRKKLRTSLTLLSVVVAFVLFGLLCAIKEAMTGGISVSGVNRLLVQHKVSLILLLPESYKARMEQIPGVDLATHQTWFGGTYQDPKNFFMQNPVVPEEFLSMHPEFLLPAEQMKAWKDTRTGAIVGRKTANKFHWKIGDKIPIKTPLWSKKDGGSTWEFDIVGIFDGKEKNTDITSLYFRYDYFDEAHRGDRGQVGWYTVRVKDPKASADVAKLIDKEFENSMAEVKAEPEAAMAQSWANQMGDIGLMTLLILLAVFFTILLVTGNTMYQAVRERTGELGVLKAIGFTNNQVVVLVFTESCILATMGGVLGLGLAWAITAGGDPTGGMLPMFFLPPRDLIIGLGISVALGLATGLFPALLAMRLQVAVALRRM
ncbi:MAG: ytrF [Pedosphaera sp.]|nr:ytrF [Pedosphaera sp.]